MRRTLLIIFCLRCFCVAAQNSHERDSLNLGLTAYYFDYDKVFEEGSVAIGPSFFLNDKKLSIELGLWVDTKKYITYEGGSHFTPSVAKENLNFFLPILFHYYCSTGRKFNFYLTLGFILGGKYYVDPNQDHKTLSTNGINFLAGAGVAYQVTKKIALRVSPAIRYSEGIYFPGILVDLTIPISKK